MKVVFQIVVPRYKPADRRSRYVSPATQSISIAFKPKNGQKQIFNRNLTALSSYCTQSATAPLTCSIVLSLAPGKYTASFTTYAGTLAKGSPTGAKLSENQQLPFTVPKPGSTSRINVTLDGIPTAVALIPAADSTLSGNQSSGYALAKCAGTQKVTVFGVDASGNYIIGPGAPTPSLKSNSAALAIATPGPFAPNQYTITPMISSTGFSAGVTAAVKPLKASGATTQSAQIALSVAGGTQICGVLTEFPIPTSGSAPQGITAGPDGALWFTEKNSSKIGRIPTSAIAGAANEISEFPLPTSSSNPCAIALGSDGALWFTECATGQRIARIPTNATPGSGAQISEYPVAGCGANGIASGADGALWFTGGSSCLGRIPTDATPGSSAQITLWALSTGFLTTAIAEGPDDVMWFGLPYQQSLGRVTTSGAISQLSGTIGPTATLGLTTGPDGNLWYTVGSGILRATTLGTVTGYSGSTLRSLQGITSGPDGALWFADCGSGKIGRIPTYSPPGTEALINEFPIPTVNAQPWGIAAGPDGALWFTESSGNKIGRLQ